MKQLLFQSRRAAAPIFLRILLGIVLFPHGAQKLLGWYGGFGFDGSMGYFTGTVGLPWIVGFLVILVEFFAPLFLIFGFATRLASLSIFFVMAGIVVTSMHDYFFMNWFGNQKSEGMEFFLLAMGMSLALVVSGSGRWAVDNLLAPKEQSGASESLSLSGFSGRARRA
ncbi:MAG: DoxX family protein [Chitinophagaceae bacterium]|nr:MAG: DoxX family protein [Chitinophagaceae bacterium]